MSFRVFEGKSHAEIYRKYREKPPKILIERIKAFLREKYSGDLTLAVDLGTGSGQCAMYLAEHFSHVIGTDISEAQIHEANAEVQRSNLKNVSFFVSPAEKIPLKEDHKAQLITICTAAHWLDMLKVYKEARRVLCPHGVLALLCSDEMIISLEKDDSKRDELKRHMDWVNGFLRTFFASPVQLVFDKYKDIEIPFSDMTREYDFKEEKTVSLSSIMGVIRSLSAFQTFCKEYGEDAGEEFLKKVLNGFLTITGLKENEVEDLAFTQTNVYFVVMARV